MKFPSSDPQPPNLGVLRAFIFDLDGTLLDTLGDLAASVNYALHTHGMPKRSIDEVRGFVGNGVQKLMERAVPDGTANPQFDAAFQTFRDYYLEHFSSIPLNQLDEEVLNLLRIGIVFVVMASLTSIAGLIGGLFTGLF